MKNAKILVTLILLTLTVGFLMALSSCSGDSEAKPDAAELLQSGQWKVQTVTVDGANHLSLFTGLQVTFSGTSFTATNGEPVWPTTGTWTLSETTIMRGDGMSMTINSVSETSLALTLVWSKTTLGSGRINSIDGTHVFTFGK